MSSQSRRTTRFLAAITLLGLAVGACSGASPTTPAATGGPGATPAGSSSDVPPTSGGGTSGVIDVCQVLSVADIQPLFLTKITSNEDTAATGETSACFYQVDPHDGLAPMEITAVHGDQASPFVASFHGGNEGPYVDIPNLGDQAFRRAGQASLVAIKGATACSIQLGGGNSSHYAGMASPDPDGNIADDSATAFVAKLVPLCQKIFAAAGQ